MGEVQIETTLLKWGDARLNWDLPGCAYSGQFSWILQRGGGYFAESPTTWL